LRGERTRRIGGRPHRVRRVRQNRPAGTVYFGEIGLSGEIRQVAQAEARLKERPIGFDARALRGDSRTATGGWRPTD